MHLYVLVLKTVDDDFNIPEFDVLGVFDSTEKAEMAFASHVEQSAGIADWVSEREEEDPTFSWYALPREEKIGAYLALWKNDSWAILELPLNELVEGAFLSPFV